jgi:hypothetical protein
MTEIESWRELPGDRIEFKASQRRLTEPAHSVGCRGADAVAIKIVLAESTAARASRA